MPKYLKGMVIWSIMMVVSFIGQSFTKDGVCPWAWTFLTIVWFVSLCAYAYSAVKHIKSTRKDS